MSDKRATANTEPKRMDAVPGRSFKQVRFRRRQKGKTLFCCGIPAFWVSFLKHRSRNRRCFPPKGRAICAGGLLRTFGVRTVCCPNSPRFEVESGFSFGKIKKHPDACSDFTVPHLKRFLCFNQAVTRRTKNFKGGRKNGSKGKNQNQIEVVRSHSY